MPQIPVNYLAILAGGVASMALGYLWYGPFFGKMWMTLTGMKMEDMTEAKKKAMGKSYLLMFVGCLVTGYVSAHSLVFASTYLNVYGVTAGLMSGFWLWLGFIAPVTMGTVLWDGKPWKLWILNNGYQLAMLLVINVILAVWQ